MVLEVGLEDDVADDGLRSQFPMAFGAARAFPRDMGKQLNRKAPTACAGCSLISHRHGAVSFGVAHGGSHRLHCT